MTDSAPSNPAQAQTDTESMPHPHNIPDNGTGGLSGTHDGHADNVASGYGLGFVDANSQTPGNHAAQLSAREHVGDNARDAWPAATGATIDPGSR